MNQTVTSNRINLYLESISNINSEFFEYNGYINKNKNFIFFNRSNDPNNVGGIKDQGDVWYSKKVFDNLWTSPENMLELMIKKIIYY